MAHILVVDDVRANAELVALRMRAEGHQAMVATSGEEALRLIERETFDLFVLDFMMPGIDGIELTRRIRQGGHHADAPILGLTAVISPETWKRAMEAGMSAVLSKPYSKRELLDAIDGLLSP